ncbi:DUF6152 family protein [Leucothrix arctica]|uniref:Uncharacterized protein n=1 Tax=Leucothrix arctica TaxID=1481894 RepID=A0A317C4A9_9GAMM|nr:DUF6152 family protein [Leucothrix arctica]PWQ93444.1 hypothetical protein DKT75_17600 [Leucothrix arctica]
MQKKIITGAISVLASMAIIPSVSFGHHGVNGQFDLSKTLEKTGTVTRVRFVNPHSYVYFDVKDDAGKVANWRCELRSGSLLKRKGWKKELFSKGTEIKIAGSPARKEPTTCYTDTVTFSDGRMLSRYGSFDKSGKIVNPKLDAAALEAAAKKAGATLNVPDLSGNWGEPVADGPPVAYGVGRPPAYELTQAAKDVGNKWTSADNPRFNCKPTNIILDYRFDQMINKFEQSATEITLTYGFMDVVRKIHLDGKFPDKIEPTLAGYSVGTWKDGKLEVKTKGFAEGFIAVIGGRSKASIPHSDQMEVAETFYIDDKGELVREYTMTDPVYLAKPFSHLNKSVKTTDAFESFACDDLTVEEGFTEKS